MEYRFSTKHELLEKLRGYSVNPDDDNIRWKNKVKTTLLNSPELLYAIHDSELENELFDEDGNLNTDGEWDAYFGEHSHIRPYLFIPQVQTDVSTLVCYQVSFNSTPKYNEIEKYGTLTFYIICYGSDIIDQETGISRHDLISAILCEKFNWSNIFGTKMSLVSNREATTDNNYVMRTLVFQNTTTNSIVETRNGVSTYINKKSLRDSFKNV